MSHSSSRNERQKIKRKSRKGGQSAQHSPKGCREAGLGREKVGQRKAEPGAGGRESSKEKVEWCRG